MSKSDLYVAINNWNGFCFHYRSTVCASASLTDLGQFCDGLASQPRGMVTALVNLTAVDGQDAGEMVECPGDYGRELISPTDLPIRLNCSLKYPRM